MGPRAKPGGQPGRRRAGGAGLVLAVGLLAARAAAGATAAAEPLDFCAPCLSGADCLTGVCVADEAGNATCSLRCGSFASGASCPAGTTCQKLTGDPATVCRPTSAEVCARRYRGAPRNVACMIPSSVDARGQALKRTCQQSDNCFGIGSPQVGYCVEACTRNDPDVQCSQPGDVCCYAQNAAGACITSLPGVVDGGCFTLRKPGQSCILAQTALCETGAVCASPTADPMLGVCFRSCQAGCLAEEVCAQFQGASICCDRARFDGQNSGTCVPATGVCLRRVGVACDRAADCASGLCLQTDLGGVCSQPCRAASDCPADADDVNDDGAADGGSLCAQRGDQYLCLPKLGIAAPPACAQTTAAGGSAGGGTGVATGGATGGAGDTSGASVPQGGAAGSARGGGDSGCAALPGGPGGVVVALGLALARARRRAGRRGPRRR